MPAAHWSHGSVPVLAAGTTSGIETMTLLLPLMARLELRQPLLLQGEDEMRGRKGERDKAVEGERDTEKERGGSERETGGWSPSGIHCFPSFHSEDGEIKNE